jgi:periplasmic nitrate reductase NapE
MSPADEKPGQHSKTEEFRSFLFLTVVMAPVLTGVIIAGYGFLVWMFQLISGPPGGS